MNQDISRPRQDLDSMVVSVSDKNPSALHPYAVGTVKLARAIARLAPREKVLAIGAEEGRDRVGRAEVKGAVQADFD